MNRLSILAVAFAALLAAGAGSGGGQAEASPQTPERTCPRDTRQAVIAGAHRCLKIGQRCSRRSDRSYHRYGFHCHGAVLTRRAAAPQPRPFPITGRRVPGMASFDRIVPAHMRQWRIPGGAIAVVKDGRLVYARGFGYADRAARQPLQPDALFRIASVSKPVTAAAILKLVEQGRLNLDARAYPMLPEITPPSTCAVDPRIYDVTVRQLLWHTGGWDRDRPRGFDPMFWSAQAAQTVGAPAPASAETVMRAMLCARLDFDPGTRSVYSNFGYAILGRVIERASGQPYEQYVRDAVLAPAGATRMRVGRTRAADRIAGEVRYYHPGTTTSVFPGGGRVAIPYGGFYLEAMDAPGGWVASTVDLLRFVTAVDGLQTRPDVLTARGIQLMTERPPLLYEGISGHYAMGWAVRPFEFGGHWWHEGSLPGTASIVVRLGTGLAWAAVFNAREMGRNSSFQLHLPRRLWEAVNAVTSWPAHDLFTQFP